MSSDPEAGQHHDQLPETEPEPSPITTTALSPSLDALLSPTEAGAHFPMRESVAASDATDDDARFSTVALTSTRDSFSSMRLSVGSDEFDGDSIEDRRKTIAVGSLDLNAAAGLVGQQEVRTHKKTASTSTILSGRSISLMIADSDEGSRRSSIEGQHIIQEKFARKHDDLEEEENSVDWGAWYFRAGIIDPELESTYLRLLKEISPHEKAITRDLGRTFPQHAFFTDGRGIGQENLFNVLKAYSLYDPQVGFCQGLPFVAAILLLYMPDEEAFCLLVRLMYSYDLRGHFLPDMPKLQLRIFERLVEEHAPVLHVHFLRERIKSSMYCSQWFMTMFSTRLPMDVVFRIYDNCLASGIEALFSFGLALLLKNETTLLSLTFDQLVTFLNNQIFDVYQVVSSSSTEGGSDGEEEKKDVKYDTDQFVVDALSLKITSFMLDSYAHEYEELVRTKNAHAIEMDALRNSNRNLSVQVKTLESSLAQLNTEHCELLTELVRARLRHEELESELVRYKLLYAEAMHKSEDAMSSHRISLAASKRGSGSTG
ncbi:RabGAP/TBC [Laetiporus sulphureus 93-53]|uniref:RabGAP/TBC n=1 Tax=Laetiporus sulphureus 93-53 TaxID=1314785 RepID=A0A165GXT0_9APHY|nr:RabGAP/TBC [Laetiporus sulphureus 93-53]KZT10974.1 RabGAP/TBC [Laetiporus sulphureus 93-53]